MIKALIDLNVILDFLNKRQFHAEAGRILSHSGSGRIGGFVSAHEITTLAYFLDKEGGPGDDYRQVISLMFTFVKVLPMDQEVLEKALFSKVSDYEDAVLEEIALRQGLDYIVTRNVRDFKKSRVEAVNPSLFLELLQEDA